MNTLADRVAVITGGSRGLGLAIARAFIQEGASVIVASRSKDSVEKAVEELKETGGKADGLTCHVADLEQVQALAQYAIKVFDRLDIWINNAGLSCPTGPTAHIPPSDFKALMDTNIKGVYHGSFVAMQHFLPQREGKLINMLGKGERRPVPLHNAYASSKAWARNFTVALAKEYKDSGVGVYLLNPGLVDTDMLHHLHFIDGYQENIKIFKVVTRMWAKPPQIAAEKAVWLASPATDGRTGISVNAMTPRVMLGGLFEEMSNRLLKRPLPERDVQVSLIEPAINLPKSNKDINDKPRSSSVGQADQAIEKMAYICKLSDKQLPDTIGNKAKNLRRLQKKGYPQPVTYICNWKAHEDFLMENHEVVNLLKDELDQIVIPGQRYAVRSSANIEDRLDHSFAGQFLTVLNVSDVDQILSAIKDIWTSTQTDAIKSYLQRLGIETDDLKMAVIIQEMVNPVYSGVAFSRNPITSLDEIVVEAVEGSGELLVQEGITPYRWVNKWGNWIEMPDDSDVPIDIIEKVVNETQKIARKFKMDVDLEWVYDGQNLKWVQMRDITSLAKANIYSNRMSKEMTPGLVKPLVWSVILPIKGGVWVDLINEVTGNDDLDPASLAKAIYYRSYHNLGVFGPIFESLGLPRESLEMMMGVAPPNAGKPPMKPSMKTILLMPRIMRFLFHKWNFAKVANTDFPRLQSRAKAFSLEPENKLTAAELIEELHKIAELNKQISYNSVVVILLMQIYNAILRSRLQAVGVDFQDFALTEGLKELREYDPSDRLASLSKLYNCFDESTQERIKSSSFNHLQDIPGTEDFQQAFNEFIEQFGHMSDKTGEFDCIPWRENPDLILDMVTSYQSRNGQDSKMIQFRDLRVRGLRGWILKVFYRRARQFRLYREKYSSLYTYNLLLFRIYYLVLGDHLVQKGLIHSPEDIYYLYEEEVRSIVDGQVGDINFADLAAQRQDEMEQCQDYILPEVIYGDDLPPVVTATDEKLTGIPTSKGYYTGKTKVVHSISEFNKLNPGEVLVIPYSDVSWTPLFAKAGAVIAESGGMLSHSSIIAREYNIPAVVSASGAMQLDDNTLVSIDGYRGEIMIHANR